MILFIENCSVFKPHKRMREKKIKEDFLRQPESVRCQQYRGISRFVPEFSNLYVRKLGL